MKYIVFIILAYLFELFEFLKMPQLLAVFHYSLLALGILSLLYQLFNKRISKGVFIIFILTVMFPVYASIQSNIIFGQPFLVGLASMRYLQLFNIGLFLNAINYDYRLLLKQINSLNIFIAIAAIIAVFVLGINHTNIYLYIANNNLIEKGAGGEDVIKGVKLAVCSRFMVISYIYYLIRIMSDRYNKKDILIFALLMFYLLFVHKGRQPLALVAVIYAVYYIRMRGLTVKRIFLGILPLLGIVILMFKDSSVIGSFAAVLEGSNTTDSSTMARLNSIESVVPYIKEHLIWGIGNLSYHFNEGFHGIFSHQFYIADIGIIGAVARGGVALLIIYYALYWYIYTRTKLVSNNFYREYLRYMVLGYVLYFIIFSNDALFSGGFAVGLIFFPLLTSKNPNIYFNR